MTPQRSDEPTGNPSNTEAALLFRLTILRFIRGQYNEGHITFDTANEAIAANDILLKKAAPATYERIHKHYEPKKK